MTATSAAEQARRRDRFQVDRRCCVDCSTDLSETLQRVPGVTTVEWSPSAGVLVVEHDGRVSEEAVRREAGRSGIALLPVADGHAEKAPRWWRQARFLMLGAASAVFVAGFVLDALGVTEVAANGLYLATIAVGGIEPAKSAWRALRSRRLTISTLLVVAVAGAIALGVYEEAALLTIVFSLGAVLEGYVSDRARGSIRALMALTPPTARRRAGDGSLEEVGVELLEPGDVVLVRPGERLPTDGVVVAGASAVDQSAVTGESMPVEVAAGAEVFGGTMNGVGALEIRVTKEYADTTLARIIRQVEEAQSAKGSGQRFADRFGAVYTPAMFGLALIVAVVPSLIGASAREWIYRALVVLVVSCSCGLVMSVPAAVVAAISRAARSGILIKGGAYLEALAAVRAVAFDKTGTLTHGRPELTDLESFDGLERAELLRLAASVEAASEHPLAAAIVRAAEAEAIDLLPAADLRADPGVGVEATVDGRRLFIGRLDSGGNGSARSRLNELEAAGKTAVVVADADRRPLGLIAVADGLRPESAEVITALRELGIERVLMLTGDNERVAAAIARRIGIDDWRAGLLPEDKTAAIESLRQEHGAIAMLGDGVNDAPALAVAEVGIAMGAAGSDVALETADVALMADDLTRLPAAIRLARRALANIRQNIVMSLATIAVLVPAALLGYLSLTTGLLLNEGTALLIIANGLRLLRDTEAASSPAPASLHNTSRRRGALPHRRAASPSLRSRKMISNLPLVACSLDTADQPKRLTDWAELLGQARTREEISDGVRYTFAADHKLKRRAEALAAAEHSCCSFLEFEIAEAGDELEVSVTALPNGQEALRLIFAPE
jgi:Cd2+/Zn2+-exporting ATPase